MGHPTAFFGSQKKKLCHLNDRRLLKPTLDGKKPSPPVYFYKYQSGSMTPQNDKNPISTVFQATKDREGGLIMNPFQNIFIGLIENKVSCINKHKIYTSIT